MCQISFFEASLSKGHPIGTLEQVRAQYKAQGIPVRIRFRGPRQDSMRLTCLKKDAKTFAVYPR
jgi:hypothetical protein